MHYSLAIIYNEEENYLDIDDIMDLYSEHKKVAPYRIYTRSEAIEKYRKFDNSDISDSEVWALMSKGYPTDKDGNIYSICNPAGKWDFYDIGGRFENMLHLKSGEDVNCARIKDIDFSRYEHFSTWAVITPDLLWHEKDWTATDEQECEWNKNYFNEFIANENPNFYLIIIDYHN